jgi:hypothetical protein
MSFPSHYKAVLNRLWHDTPAISPPGRDPDHGIAFFICNLYLVLKVASEEVVIDLVEDSELEHEGMTQLCEP